VSGRCETCEHWKFAEPDWQFDSLVIGECKAIRMREDIETSAAEKAGFQNRWDDGAEEAVKAGLLAAKAIAVDGSGYYAAVRTTADFGCVLHATPHPAAQEERSNVE
jgi:hypothetical protein